MCRILLTVAGILACWFMLTRQKKTTNGQAGDRLVRDFPTARYQAIDDRFRRFVNSAANHHPNPFDQEFVLAWVALLYRYQTADLNSEEFHSLWLTHGRGPGEPFVYHQERAFQGFHFNALSSIETGCYALYMLASKLNANLNLYGTNPTQNLRRITINNCDARLQQTGVPAALATFFTSLVADAQFQELSDIRNVSSHRSVILRIITVGGANPNQTEIDVAGTRIPLDENFTEVRRLWIANRIEAIIDQAEQLLNAAGVPL